MAQVSRRSVLRAGGGLALTTTIAGCTSSSGSASAQKSEIPGVKDGKIVDSHAFANAHSEQLSSRSGTVKWKRVSLDPDTADPKTHSLWTVRVEGERVHAVINGKALFSGNGTDRLDIYFGDDSTYYRTKTDGTGKTRSTDEAPVSKSELTGKSTLESASMQKVGMEKAYGTELYRFSNVIHQPDNDRVKSSSVQALVDGNALGYRFQRTSNGKTSHRFDEWHVTNLNETTVQRPDWVEG